MSDLKISISIDANQTTSGANEAKRAVRGVGDEAEKTGRRVSSLFKVDYSAAIKQIKEYGDRIKNLGSQVSSAGQSLSIGLTAPILGLALLIGGLGTTYESALNTFQAVTKATSEEMAQASQVAKQLGADVSLPATSAKDAALAMSELGKAGLTAAESMAAAKGVLQLAAAGQLEEAKAAEIAANALNSFSLKAEEATRVADLLAAASNASSAEVTDVAESFSQASASFAAAKIPIEDLTTAIALLANAGIKGSDAGTSLKTFLSSLQAPSKEGARALQELGVTVFDLEGKMKSLPDIIGQFDKSLTGLTDEKKVQAIQAIFGSDASRAAQILFKEGAAGFEQIKNAVTQTGAAADLAAAKTKGVGGAFESLKSQVETIGITIFDALKGPAEQGLIILAENLGKVSDYLSNLGQSNPEIIQMAAIFLAVVAAVGPLLVILGTLISFVGSVVTGITTLIPIFAAVGGAVATFGSAILGVGGFIVSFIGLIGEAGLVASFTGLATVVGGAIVPAIGSFLTALAPIVIGVTAVVAVIGILIGIGVALFAAYQTNFGGLKDLVDGVFNSIVSTIQSGLQAIQDFWTTYGAQIVAVATSTFNSIIEFIRPIMTEVVSTVGEAFQTIVEVVGPLMTQVLTFIETNLKATLIIVRAALAGISAFWTEHGAQIKAIVASVWTILKTIVIEGIRQIANVITLVLAVINGDWKAAWTAFKTIIQSGVTAAVTIFKSLNTLIYNALAFIATDVYNIGKNIIQGLINGISSGAAALYEKASNIANSLIGIFKSVPEVQSPSKVTTRIGEFITEGLAVGIQNKESLAVNAAKKVAAEVIKAFQDAQKEFSKLAGASPATIQTIQAANQTSEATSAQQEIIKLRGDLQTNNDLPLPTDVAGTIAELKYLKERQKAIEDAIPPYQQLANIEKELREARDKDLEDFDKIKDFIAANGAAELLQAQKEFDLLGVTDDFEKKRIENASELLKLRQQLSNDGYGEEQIKDAVELAKVENARVLELLRLRQLKQESIDKDKKIKDEELKAADEAAKQYENKVSELSDSLYRIFSAGAKDGFKGFLKQGLEELKNFGKKLLDDILGSLADSLSKFLLGKISGKGSSGGGGFFDIIKNLFNRGGSSSGGSSGSGGGFLNTIRGLFGGGGASSSGSSSGGGANPFSAFLGNYRPNTNALNAGLPTGATNSAGQFVVNGSRSSGGGGVGLAGGVAIAGAAANIVGGLIGGRAGSFISNIGSGAALGAQIGSLFGPGPGTAIGAAIGAAGGFLVSLFGGDPKRKKDKKENLPALQKSFAEALSQIRALGADKNAFYSDPEGTISKAVELRGQIASGFGIKFESKKYQKESQKQIAAKLVEADGIIAELQRLKNRAVRARDVDSQLQTSFATGVYLRDDQMSEMKRALDFKRRNGKLAGNFNGIDTLPSMLAKGEMVLNPTQIQNVILNAGDDPFKNAGIPGYNTGTYIAPSPSAPSASATAAPVNSFAPNVIKIENITLVVEKDENGNVSFKELLVDNLKKSDVQVQVVESYDKGKSRNR